MTTAGAFGASAPPVGPSTQPVVPAKQPTGANQKIGPPDAPPAATPGPSPSSPNGTAAPINASVSAPAFTPLTPPAGGEVGLSQATSSAVAASIDLKAAAAQVAAARERVAQAQAGRRFQVQWQPNASIADADVIQPPPKHETFTTLVNALNFPLPIGRKIGATIRQAQADLVNAEANYQKARLDLAQATRVAYYDALRARALREVAEETLRQADRQRNDAQIRLDAGDVARLDVLRAQVPVEQARAGLLQAINRELVARRSLNALLHYSPDTVLSLRADTLVSHPSRSLAEIEAAADANAPEVILARTAVNQAQTAIDVARRALDPTYAASVTDTRSNDKTGLSRVDAVQLTATIPLRDGGTARAQVRERLALLTAAESQLSSARVLAKNASDTAYYSVETSLRQVDAARVAVDIARQASDLTAESYRVGHSSLRDALDAQAAYAQARAALEQAIYDAFQAQAALVRATGEDPG